MPKIKTFYVDGGLTSNPFLMQFQSNVLQRAIKYADREHLGAAKASF